MFSRRKKRWYCMEFSEKGSVIPSLTREAMLRTKILEFLNQNNLKPSDCMISCHMETVDPLWPKRNPEFVCQIFYYGASELFLESLDDEN